MLALNLLAEPSVSSGAYIARGPDPEVLGQIEDRSIELALWTRSLLPVLGDWLDSEDPSQLPDDRRLVRLTDLRAAVTDMIKPQGKSRIVRGLLADDVIDLARRFAAIAKSDIVDIRLEVIRHDACWRFHRDATPLRLLTTYRGPGTQLPPPDQAERALREQRDCQGPLENLPRHAVALFKGDPDGAGLRVLHRSPPIAGREIARFFLCLNLPSNASSELWQP